jgi:hypothetical protein
MMQSNVEALPTAEDAPRKQRLPVLCLRHANVFDLVPLVVLAGEFFNEAGWKAFTNFNHEGMKLHFEHVLNTPFNEHGQSIIMCDELMMQGGNVLTRPVGFIKFGLQVCSTTEPIGVLDAVYVLKELRLSHAGRMLFAAAENHLRALGACAFFASPGARMGSVDKSMSNMLGRMGFDIQVANGVKVLR